MEINKGSWHYRVYRWWSGEENAKESLCGYFWKIVGGAFVGVFIGIIIILFLLSIVAGAVSLVYWALNSFETFVRFGIVIIMMVGLVFLIFKGWQTETFKLVRAYISAKKRKVCPLITFIGSK